MSAAMNIFCAAAIILGAITLLFDTVAAAALVKERREYRKWREEVMREYCPDTEGDEIDEPDFYTEDDEL